ncbi:MAG: TrkA C-terminal domain-containing protein, partial [Sciscionella sp.]
AGLKGAVPILLGSFILSAGVDGASRVYNVIFVVVLFSVIVQGGLVPTVAKALKVPMRPVEPEPFSLGVRFRNEPQALRRYILERGAPADGCTLEELPLQEGTWVSLVIRNGSLVTVTGDTVLKAGDEIVALADPESEHDPKRMFTRAED